MRTSTASRQQPPLPSGGPHRAWAAIAVLLLAVPAIAGARQAAPASAPDRRSHRPPAAGAPPRGAYVRLLGVIPPTRPVAAPAWARSNMGFVATEPRTALSARGIALGGFGAGAFQINQSGTFGPWSFGAHEMRILPQAAFHVRIERAGKQATVKTLALDGPLGRLPAAWPQIGAGSATYSAMYPFGWIEYRGLDAGVAMRFWSPIVAGDDRRTSMPLAHFDVTLSNPTASPLTASVMFTFPNAPVHVPSSGKTNWMTGKAMYVPQSVRTGLFGKAEADRGVRGVTLGATGAQNTVDARDTAWTIAAMPRPGQQFSSVSSWNAAGDGSDILGAFAATGTLPDRALDRSGSAGAIAVKVALAPGAQTVVPFVLAWDVPREVYRVTPQPARRATAMEPARPAIAGGTSVWMKRYTGFFGARTDRRNAYVPGSYRPFQSFAIARAGLLDRVDALNAVESWWNPIARNDRYPDWLRGAALNQTAYLAFGHSFWALGLESDTVGSPGGRPLGTALPDTHPFAVDTGAEGADESMMNGDVAPYADAVTQLLFPNLERNLLRTYGELLQRSDEAQLHNLGSSDGGSPFVTWDNRDGTNHIDRTLLFAARWWRYVGLQRDEPMFRWLYPTMVKTWKRHKTNFFRPDSRLPLDPPFLANTHDMLSVHGHGVYNSSLWIMFEDLLAAATDRAVALGIAGADPLLAKQLRIDARAARVEFEARFWDEGRGYYRFDTGRSTPYSAGLFSDAFYSEHLAATLGLPPVTRPDRLRRHLRAVDRILIMPFATRGGLPVGAANLADDRGQLYGGLNVGAKPFGEAPDGREIWPGASYPLASLMMTTGQRTGDTALIASGLALGEGVSRVIWNRPDLGYAFQAPEAWSATDVSVYRNPSYLRPLSVWDLLDRVMPVRRAPVPVRQRSHSGRAIARP